MLPFTGLPKDCDILTLILRRRGQDKKYLIFTAVSGRTLKNKFVLFCSISKGIKRGHFHFTGSKYWKNELFEDS